ncbi:hypothetical protein DFH07DRAFT_782265 [Mycena maculata]|uniref:Uncharacterized protein n=1 Tax=Mycena maculata TaxID=230809 RepID=A0AAD7HTY3_9AGAR|nr:hypothetical protein DFH07DRAFT_782265 [Mycena maculata]
MLTFPLVTIGQPHARESDIFGLANGLAPAQTGFFGLGLGFEWRSKPKPGISACKPVCSLSRETGLRISLVPHVLFNQSECIHCLQCDDMRSALDTTSGNIVNLAQNYGLSGLSTLCWDLLRGPSNPSMIWLEKIGVLQDELFKFESAVCVSESNLQAAQYWECVVQVVFPSRLVGNNGDCPLFHGIKAVEGPGAVRPGRNEETGHGRRKPPQVINRDSGTTIQQITIIPIFQKKDRRCEAAAAKNPTREVKQCCIHLAWAWGRMAFLCRDWEKYILVKMAWAYAKWFGPAQSVVANFNECSPGNTTVERSRKWALWLQSLDLVPTPKLEEAERNERVMGVSAALLQLLAVQNDLGELLNLNGDILNDILDCRATRRHNDGKGAVAAMFAAIPQRSRRSNLQRNKPVANDTPIPGTKRKAEEDVEEKKLVKWGKSAPQKCPQKKTNSKV